MAKDVIARLKVEHSQWDSGFSKAGKQLTDFQQKNMSLNGVMQQSIGTLTKFAAGYVGLQGAIAGAKKLIESTEATHDAYARGMYAMKQSVDAFFVSISTGNFNAFLNGLDEIINKANEAYNALDSFGSYMTRFNPNANALRQQVQVLEQEARALKANGDIKGAQAKLAQAQTIANQLKANTTQAGKMQTKAGYADLEALMYGHGATPVTKGKMAWYADPKNWDQVNAKAAKFAQLKAQIESGRKEASSARKQGETAEGYSIRIGGAQRRINQAEAALKKDASLNNAYVFQNLRDDMQSEEGQRFNAALTNIYGNVNAKAQNQATDASIKRLQGILGRAAGTGKGTTKATTTTTPKDTAEGGTIGYYNGLISAEKQWQTNHAKTIDDFDKSNAKIKSYEEAIKSLHGTIQEEQKVAPTTALSADWFKEQMQNTSGMAMNSDAYKVAIQQNADWVMLQDSMDGTPLTLGVDVTDEEWEAFKERIQEMLSNLGIEGIEIPINVQTIDKAAIAAKKLAATQNALNGAASALSSIGGALQSLQDPGAKVAGIIMEAIATIAQTFAASLKGTFTPWDWIAAAAAGTATMISTITAIKSATSGSYADGGIISGNHYVGDSVQMANVNSGELILNYAQQDQLASNLQGGASASASTPYVTGEKIVMGINNWGKRTGRGELTFAK